MSELRAGLGFLPAARVVLRSAKTSLTAAEIVQRAQAVGVLQSQGKTPANTLSALLERELRLKGASSDFVKVARGRFALRARGEPARQSGE